MQNKADYNKLNNHSLSPLYLAILNGRISCVEYLLDNGAKVFYSANDLAKDRSPIFLAIRFQQDH